MAKPGNNARKRHGPHERDTIVSTCFSHSGDAACSDAVANKKDARCKGREFQMQQEKELLQVSLEQGKYNQKRAAELLGLTYHQFRALLKKHQL